MMYGTRFERGDILMMHLPFSDLSSTKIRPVLVISDADHNSKQEDLILCGITTNLRTDRSAMPIDNYDLRAGSLPSTCAIRPDKFFTLDKSLVQKTIGAVKPHVIERVQWELRRLLGIGA
jgi:mRNA interferase MazF